MKTKQTLFNTKQFFDSAHPQVVVLDMFFDSKLLGNKRVKVIKKMISLNSGLAKTTSSNLTSFHTLSWYSNVWQIQIQV